MGSARGDRLPRTILCRHGEICRTPRPRSIEVFLSAAAAPLHAAPDGGVGRPVERTAGPLEPSGRSVSDLLRRVVAARHPVGCEARSSPGYGLVHPVDTYQVIRFGCAGFNRTGTSRRTLVVRLPGGRTAPSLTLEAPLAYRVPAYLVASGPPEVPGPTRGEAYPTTGPDPVAEVLAGVLPAAGQWRGAHPVAEGRSGLRQVGVRQSRRSPTGQGAKPPTRCP